MNQLEALLLITGIPCALLFAGYWLVVHTAVEDLSARIAVGMLAGLCSLLLTVSVVNLFFPITGVAAGVCLLPVALTLIGRRSRTRLGQDLRAVLVSRSAWICMAVVATGFACILWPALRTSTILMYDGTSNHDSFFWVNVAEHLQRHTYMENPVWSPLQPAHWAAEAAVGWQPAWGRMGAEGLMALTSAVVGLSPLKLYLFITACLLYPWLAATHLAIRTFYADRLSWPAVFTLLACPPVFLFFYNNSNLPNLVGVIAGTTAILATAQTLRAADGTGWRSGWVWLMALGLHGMYCAYSEMLPFVLLPCGLLWLHHWASRATRADWQPRWHAAGAVIVSLLINPASTFRAGWGFYAAFVSARADDRWGGIFALLHPAQYLPAMGTLAATAVKWLGFWVGLLLTILLVLAVVLAWRRARHPVGALLAFAGGFALLAYTLAAQFLYGWQKSVQFSAILVSALVSGVLVDALWQTRFKPAWSAWFFRLLTACQVAFLLFATGMQHYELYKWSERKQLSHDWFDLRQQSRTTLLEKPVLIEAATFRMAFFHGMWAAYFLNESHVYYGLRGEQTGGYLRQRVVHESSGNLPPPSAILVGRDWADAFDANSERLLVGTEYVLLKVANRVFSLEGVFPTNGTFEATSGRIEMDILPHSSSELVLQLRAEWRANGSPAAEWRVTRQGTDHEDLVAPIGGTSDWTLRAPLVAGQRNRLVFHYTGTDLPANVPLPFAVTGVQIRNTP